MGWSEATFTNRSGKKQKVWVKSADGKVVVEQGRVEMKYSDADDAKTYRANLANLEFGGETTARRAASTSKKAGTKRREPFDELIWKAPEGARHVSHDVPRGLKSKLSVPAGVIDAWTDGACTGNPGPAGYGVVLVFDGQYLEICQYLGIGTNNIAELYAIRVALEELREVGGSVRIHTDSSYSIGVLDKGWKAKANQELVASIRELMEEFDPPPKFVKVKGHAGIPLNERADRLAVTAIERHVTSEPTWKK